MQRKQSKSQPIKSVVQKPIDFDMVNKDNLLGACSFIVRSVRSQATRYRIVGRNQNGGYTIPAFNGIFKFGMMVVHIIKKFHIKLGVVGSYYNGPDDCFLRFVNALSIKNKKEVVMYSVGSKSWIPSCRSLLLTAHEAYESFDVSFDLLLIDAALSSKHVCADDRVSINETVQTSCYFDFLQFIKQKTYKGGMVLIKVRLSALSLEGLNLLLLIGGIISPVFVYRHSIFPKGEMYVLYDCLGRSASINLMSVLSLCMHETLLLVKSGVNIKFSTDGVRIKDTFGAYSYQNGTLNVLSSQLHFEEYSLRGASEAFAF